MTDTQAPPVIEVVPTNFDHLTTELMAALVKAQQQAESAEKDGKAERGSSRERGYTSTDAVSRAAKQAFAGTGLAWFHEPLTHEAATDRLIMRWHLWHEKGGRISGESRISHWKMQGMSAPQARGAVASYARKYALTAILLLDRDDGSDLAVEESNGRGRGYDRRPDRRDEPRAGERRTTSTAPRGGSQQGIKAAHAAWSKSLGAYMGAVHSKTGDELDWKSVMHDIAQQMGLTEGWPRQPSTRMLIEAKKILDRGTQQIHNDDGPPVEDAPEPYDPGDEPNDQSSPVDDGVPL